MMLRPTYLRATTSCGFLLTLLSLLAVCGCGEGRPATVPVSGKVTFGGGPWPKPGKLYFTGSEAIEGHPQRPGVAEFDTDGQFTVTTWDEGDGLLPGKYRARVECWKVYPNVVPPDPVTPGESYLSGKYTNATASGLEVVVEPGSEPIRVNWDIPKR